jgi:NH3-dependent NAD+ synthetase
VVADGYPEEQVRRVTTLVRRSQYKRCLPPIAKISRCTVGYEILPSPAGLWPGWQ